MLSKSKLISSIVINIIIFIATTCVVGSYFLLDYELIELSGVEHFMYFTTDSNILCAVSALILAFFEIRVLRGKAKSIPNFAIILKYIGTVSVMLTFLTVVLFLGPIYTYGFVFHDTALYMHLIGPLLALFSFCFLETANKISFKTAITGLVPMAIYGAVYVTEVVFIGESKGGWKDFYSFNVGGYWYITVLIMLFATFLICLLVRFLHNKMTAKSKKTEEKIYEKV